MTETIAAQNCTERIETGDFCYIDGIRCEIIKWRFHAVKGRYNTAYKFTVPCWPECEITGKKEAKRVIHGRMDPAVRNTLGIE